MKKRVFRSISIILLVVLILVIVTVTAGVIAKSNLAKQYPAPGQLVDVDGHRMHINCMGQGSPTIILEAGVADFSLTWAYVQPEVAKITRVCSYDRAGYGWSEPGPYPRTASTEVAELHALLEKAHVQGPFVLVGHSLGGCSCVVMPTTILMKSWGWCWWIHSMKTNPSDYRKLNRKPCTYKPGHFACLDY